MAEIAEPRLPYPGLRPFEPDEVDLFFGREQQVDGLLKRLSTAHFVAVVGESGAGKSSLVRAGLLPALEAGFVIEAGSDWRVAVMRPGGDPLTALANALQAPHVLSDAGGATPLEYALAELRRGPFGLVQMVRDAHLEKHSNLLVVVDQFEELFRYCREPAQKDQANIFVELLLEATAQRQVPVSVVLTMRSDFIGDCARFRGLPEKLNDNQFLTPRLTRDQIADAIRGPARVCGGTVERDLVDELCNAVGDNQDQLPLLQHLLMRVWERASRDSRAPYLTSRLATELGGLHGALSRHAQQLYDSLPADSDQAIARAMFKSLTDPFSQRRDVRRDALVSEIAAVADVPVSAVTAVADRFRALGVHMLMPPPAVRLEAESRLDISHESLIRQWSMLSALAAEEAASAHEFERLYEEAQRQQRDTGELLSGRSLAQAAEWFDRARPTATWAKRYAPEEALALTRAFVENSVSENTRRKDIELQNAAREASAKRVKKYNWALSGLVVMAVSLAVWSITLSRRTTAAYNTLKSELQLRHSIEFSAMATLEAPKDPSLAVLLARRALLSESRDEKAAMLALRTSLASHVPTVVLSQSVAQLKNYVDAGKNAYLEFYLSRSSLSSQSDSAIVPTANDAIIWSTESEAPAERRRLHGHSGIVGSAIFSPDGNLALTTSADKTACVWNATTGKQLHCVNHDGPINGAVFSPDAKLFVTFSDDNSARVWKTDDYTLHCAPLAHQGDVASASFSAGGQRLVTLEHRSAARVWELGAKLCPEVTPPVLQQPDNQTLRSASYSPGGQWLAVVTVDGRIQVLDAARWTAAEPVELPKGVGDLPALAWHDDRDGQAGRSPARQYFAVAGGDNVGQLFYVEAASPRPRVTRVRDLRGHTGRITSIVFNVTGDRLLTTSEDRTARVWKWRTDKQGTDKRLLETLVLRGHTDTVGSAAFARNDQDVITASDDGTLRLWKPLFTLLEEKIPDKKWVALNGFDGPTLIADEAATGFSVVNIGELGPAHSLKDSVGAKFVAASPGGQFVILSKPQTKDRCSDGAQTSECILRWDANADQTSPIEIRPFHFGNKPCRVLGISRAGDRLAWYCPVGNNIAVTDLASSGTVPPYGVGKGVEHIQFSYDGSLLALTQADLSVQVVRSGTGEALATMMGHTAPIQWTEFSRDGRFLATISTTSTDATARVWDVATGDPVTTKQVPDNSVVESQPSKPFVPGSKRLISLAFSPDGSTLRLLGSGGLLSWRCYMCADRSELLEEITRRGIRSRPLTKDETKLYQSTEAELNSATGETPERQE